MVRDLCICILVPADAADVVQLVPYAVVKILPGAVDADDVLVRDNVHVCGGDVAVFIQDTMRTVHFIVDVLFK